jgi:hypothetical protein
MEADTVPMKYLLFLIFLASCSQTPTVEAPAWVEAVRNGEETLKISHGQKTFYRRIAGTPELSKETSCNLAVTRVEETIKKDFPLVDRVPYSIEVLFYDNFHKDCAVTASVNSKFERNVASLDEIQKKAHQRRVELENKDTITEDEATEILQERALIASRFALTGMTKIDFEKFAKDKVSFNSDHALCSKYFSTGSFSVHGTTHVCWRGENVVGFCTMNDSRCWTKNP